MLFHIRGACGVMFIVVGKRIVDLSSNHGRGCLNFI